LRQWHRLRDEIGPMRALEYELPQAMFVRPVVQAALSRAGGALLRRRTGPALLALGTAGALVAGAAVVLAASRRESALKEPRLRGTPQGSPLSPLLATSVLQPFDMALDRSGYILTRYVDDILLVCRDEAAARGALAESERQIARLDLALNPEKTAVQPYDAGFTFLGATLPQLPRYSGPAIPAQRALAEVFQGAGYWRARLMARKPGRGDSARRQEHER